MSRSACAACFYRRMVKKWRKKGIVVTYDHNSGRVEASGGGVLSSHATVVEHGLPEEALRVMAQVVHAPLDVIDAQIHEQSNSEIAERSHVLRSVLCANY